ncbi:nuclear transport factor 2 family protein [Serratia proteamaculans]|uniref:nuclear transport factor 2 family protein n=1 Tax=Serratia proteamaculans TaxID=28151 RepID=UPI001076423C|nr:nuclear transport factor 2 family protein [Serratia proteamaculans]TFZ51171.1 nuclear transport factor 2 family protein [Serratia proteamaculans]
MTDSIPLLALIQSLEVKLHQPATRNNIAVVSELLHDDFEEIGRSGNYYDKQQTLAALQIESGQASIFSEGFKLAIIAEGAVLLTYRSFNRSNDDGVTQCTLRSSIWLLSANDNGGQWQMRFHQGTPTNC